MSIATTCPQCQAPFDLHNNAPVRCPRCQTLLHADGIQANANLAPPKPLRLEEDPEPSPRRPTARPAFPWGPLAIVTIGVLFILLAISVAFNVYYMTGNDHRFRRFDEALRAEQLAVQQQAQAQLALQQEKEARRQLELLREEAEKAKQRFDELKEQQAQAVQPKWGTLEGRVVWTGEFPKVESLEQTIRRSPDKEHVLKAPKELLLDPTWRIDPKTKGVANVCVFLKRPKDGVLPIHAADKVRKDRVVMDAPFCIYEPHLVAIQPEWFDGKERGDTGQRFVTKNSSPVAQNARTEGDPKFNFGVNFVHQPKSEHLHTLKPQPLPMSVQCDIHVWMRGYVWAFDHPYFAITKADGTFTIPRVPAGMDAQVMAWHEGQGWLFTKDGRTMTLKEGKNVLDFEMSAK